ncbi:co-chaperone protein daf-41-like isoform X2 [Portunus trituberculatus]|uniref:co-chaperone protein daf-41-like isoform X2 n=1 Tax=Portunus trituberculatus TaxID=210409 RepID=UPI001E1CD810|nr:co-chaperone protein daf-41-like isoform X2 [Portunus trituberculatus]
MSPRRALILYYYHIEDSSAFKGVREESSPRPDPLCRPPLQYLPSPRRARRQHDVQHTKSRSFPRDRNIELILVKKEEGPYWPHLLKQKVKQHWLKVDFSRWKDEDDSEDEGEGQNQDLEEMMRQMGGLGGGDSRPSLDDLEDEDSDDDDLPDLE